MGMKTVTAGISAGIAPVGTDCGSLMFTESFK